MKNAKKECKRIWRLYTELLQCKVQGQEEIIQMLQDIPDMPFREGLACVVLNGMARTTGVDFTTQTALRGKRFGDMIVHVFAWAVEGYRPTNLKGYESEELAYLLFKRFLETYSLLNEEIIDDKHLYMLTCLVTFPPPTLRRHGCRAAQPAPPSIVYKYLR